MIGVDFFADFFCHGAVLGVGLDTSPDEWQNVLGSDYVDDIQRRYLRRDYGLIELAFARVESRWTCYSITVQAHRLSTAGSRVVPEALRQRYGDFVHPLPVSHFRDLLSKQECECEELERMPDDDQFHRFWSPHSRVIVHSLESSIWSLSLSTNAKLWANPSGGNGKIV